MPNSNQQVVIKELETNVEVIRGEIVAFRGLLRALLLQSTWTDDELKDFVRDAATNPRGVIDPEDAVSVAWPLIDVTAVQREKNRKKQAPTSAS